MTFQPTPTSDDFRWEKEADDLRHTGYARLQSSAGKWLTAVSGLLGIAATVSIADGAATVPTLITIVNLVAAGLAVAGLVLANLASQGTPHDIEQLDGATLRENLAARIRVASLQLRASRWAVTLCAVTLLVGLATTAFIQPSQSFLVTTIEGRVDCLSLEELTSDSGPMSVASIMSVPSCP